jgi:hypothetical protein
MQFKDFLHSKGLSLSDVARLWGVPVSTVSRPAKGQRWPSQLVMVKAFYLSEGAVGLADWIEVCRPLLESEGIIQPTGKTEDGKSTEGAAGTRRGSEDDE